MFESIRADSCGTERVMAVPGGPWLALMYLNHSPACPAYDHCATWEEVKIVAVLAGLALLALALMFLAFKAKRLIGGQRGTNTEDDGD